MINKTYDPEQELEELTDELRDLKIELEVLTDELNTLEDEEESEDFDDHYDEIFDPVRIGSLTFNASRVVKELDPIAYRMDFQAFQDGLMREKQEEIDEKQEEIDEKKDEISALEEAK